MEKAIVNVFRESREFRELDNTLATDYITENFEKLMRDSVKLGINKEFAHDAITDMYMNLRVQEENGDGYDPKMGHGDYISVEEFVYSRFKGYGKNKKYHRYFSDVEVSACGGSDVEDDGATHKNTFQSAYDMASSYDVEELELIEAETTIQDDLEHILSFQSEMSINLLGLLVNMEAVITYMAENKDMKDNHLSEIRTQCFKPDFKEAWQNVVKFAVMKPDKFDMLVAQYS